MNRYFSIFFILLIGFSITAPAMDSSDQNQEQAIALFPQDQEQAIASFPGGLPIEVFACIFNFADFPTRASCQIVCRNWSELLASFFFYPSPRNFLKASDAEIKVWFGFACKDNVTPNQMIKRIAVNADKVKERLREYIKDCPLCTENGGISDEANAAFYAATMISSYFLTIDDANASDAKLKIRRGDLRREKGSFTDTQRQFQLCKNWHTLALFTNEINDLEIASHYSIQAEAGTQIILFKKLRNHPKWHILYINNKEDAAKGALSACISLKQKEDALVAWIELKNCAKTRNNEEGARMIGSYLNNLRNHDNDLYMLEKNALLKEWPDSPCLKASVANSLAQIFVGFQCHETKRDPSTLDEAIVLGNEAFTHENYSVDDLIDLMFKLSPSLFSDSKIGLESQARIYEALKQWLGIIVGDLMSQTKSHGHFTFKNIDTLQDQVLDWSKRNPR